MIDLEAYAARALADEIKRVIPEMRVRLGPDVTLDGDERAALVFPSITLKWSDALETPDVAIVSEEDLGDGTKRVVWRRARVEIPFDVWLYTQDKEQRLALMPLIRGLFYPFDSQGRPGDLELTIPNYYNARIRFIPGTASNRDDQSAKEGYATQMLRVSANTSLLQDRIYDQHNWNIEGI